MALDSEESGPKTGGSVVLRLLGLGVAFVAAGNYMFFTKASPKYVLYEYHYDEGNSITVTMSDTDALSLILASIGGLLFLAGKPR